MSRLTYPGLDFPSPLPFVLTVPDDWLAVHLPGTMLAARSPEAVDGFGANVTVNWQRTTRSSTAKQLSGTLLRQLGGDGRVVDYDGEPEFDGSVALIRSTVERPNGPVAQMALIVVGPPTSERARDLFQVTGSYATKREDDRNQIQEILNSFAFIDLNDLEADLPDPVGGTDEPPPIYEPQE